MRIEEIGPATLINGDCREVMGAMPDSSIDAIVTDPPYGIGFMGKGWDHGIPGVEFWVEALRVAKPGAHLLAFGGTRTFHRLAVAIEDAGWEIRDCVMWVYGSGFPKSLNVQQAINKAIAGHPQGSSDPTSPNHGKFKGGCSEDNPKGQGFGAGAAAFMVEQGEARRDDKGDWQGWGTALKPAVEYVVCAQKPIDLRGLCSIVALKIGEAICQLRLRAKDAETNSASSQNERGAAADSVLWRVAPEFNTPDGLFAVMDTLQSASGLPLSLNIGLSWLNILGALWTAENTFTTEMRSGLTTDLKILNSWSSKTIADSIIEDVMRQRGIASNVSFAENIFSVVSAKLHCTLTPSVPELAISKDEAPGLHPEWCPIIVARKPLIGTVAANVQQFGTGAINIDGCRVSTEGETIHTPQSDPAKRGGVVGSDLGISNAEATKFQEAQRASIERANTMGRWPANLIHDGSDEVLALFPTTTSGTGAVKRASSKDGHGNVGAALGKESRPEGEEMVCYGDTGSAARFFYCAKASKKDRNESCEGLPLRQSGMVSNTSGHPTVKPTELMRYLCRLITPPGGTVLDPFMGSGSTGKAALKEGFNFVGIELDEEHGYFDIACARIRHVNET